MDTDFFLFRTAEAYLTYAEATARLNGGTATTEGINAINAVRGRANAVQRSGYSLNDILDEWSREFYFEGRRRVDLIRFGKFGGTTDYIWQAPIKAATSTHSVTSLQFLPHSCPLTTSCRMKVTKISIYL